MQAIKTHKILTSFNLLAIFLIIFGSSTDFLVPSSGTSISGGIAAWGELLLVVMLFVDGIVLARHHKKVSPSGQLLNNIVPTAGQKRASRARGISIILGAVLGIVATYLILAPQGGDAGLLFLPLAAILAPLGAIVLFMLSKLSFSKD